MRSGIAIRNPNNLQAVDIDPLILEDAHARGSNRIQIFAVVAELLVIPCHEKDTMRRGQPVQRLRSLGGVDGSAVKQIAGDEDEIRRLP